MKSISSDQQGSEISMDGKERHYPCDSKRLKYVPLKMEVESSEESEKSGIRKMLKRKLI